MIGRDLRQEELVQRPEGDPEAAVGRERDRGERVVLDEGPHAGEQLHQAAVGQRQPEDDRQVDVVEDADVDEAQRHGREREGGEAKRGRLGDEPRRSRLGLHSACRLVGHP
jgi:hypothetical protein